MREKKSVKRNYIYNLLYEVYLLIVPLVVTPYVARVLGSDGSGQYSFSFSVNSIFVLIASLGFDVYAQRHIASYQGDAKMQSIGFWEITISRLLSVGISIVFYLLVIYLKLFDSRYELLLQILLINIIAVAANSVFFFQGNEEFGIILFRNIIIKTISILCIFCFVKKKEDLIIYVVIQALTVLISNLSLWVYLPKMLVKVTLNELHPLRHFLPSLVLFIPAIATSVYTALDKTLIGVITNSDFENGNYEYSERIVKMVLVITASLGNVITPRNSKLFAEGDIDSVQNNINKSLRFTFFIGIPLTLGCISIADNLVPWYLGSGYEKSSTLIKLLAPLIIVIGLSNVFGRQLLIPGKKDKQYTYAIIGGAVINFVLNIVLINLIQSYGAAIATVIAESAITVIMIIYSRKLIHINSISSWIWKYTISGVIMFAPCFFLSNILDPTPLSTMLIIIVGCGVYFLLLFFTRDSFAYEMYFFVRDKIRTMLRKT